MIEEEFEKEIKVVVVGNGAVGKTSMIRRYCRGIYTDEYKKTIGVDFLEKTKYIDSLCEDVRMMVWDTAGQEEFDTITRTYYRGAGAAVLAFSTTDRDSFDAIRSWKSKVENECGPIAMCICQNKVDLIDQSVVEPGEAEALAKELGLKFYRICVKENFNVDKVFDYLVDQWSKAPADVETAPAVDIATMAAASNPSAGVVVRPPPPPAASKPAATGEEGGKAFKIDKPSAQRTGGKKKLSKRLTSACSLI